VGGKWLKGLQLSNFSKLSLNIIFMAKTGGI
jgi:hypothetical protein